MSSLTKTEVNQIDDALRRLGTYQPPWDLPVEKLPLYLLLGLCEKVSNLESQLLELNTRIIKTDATVDEIDKRVCNAEENIIHVGINNNNGVKCNE